MTITENMILMQRDINERIIVFLKNILNRFK